MVKVVKVAAWCIGDKYIEDAKEAEKAVREEIIREMLEDCPDKIWEDAEDEATGNVANWVAANWEEIENRTKKAMAGT